MENNNKDEQPQKNTKSRSVLYVEIPSKVEWF